jgi:group I intron endonuclease
MTSGVYEIVNSANGKRYIGSAVDFKRRWKNHRSTLRGNRHHCSKLQNAWNKYHEDSFVFRVILICAAEDVILYEQTALDALKPEYNTAPAAGNCLGLKHKPDALTRTRPVMKGRTHSPETRDLIAAAHRGRKHPPEFGAAISARNTGVPRPKSPEHRAKLSAALMGRGTQSQALRRPLRRAEREEPRQQEPRRHAHRS